MRQHVKPCQEMQDPQPVCSDSPGEGGSAVPTCSTCTFPSGCSTRCQASQSLPTGLGFPGFLLLKYIPAKQNTRFANGGQQIAATPFVNM